MAEESLGVAVGEDSGSVAVISKGNGVTLHSKYEFAPPWPLGLQRRRRESRKSSEQSCHLNFEMGRKQFGFFQSLEVDAIARVGSSRLAGSVERHDHLKRVSSQNGHMSITC